MPKCHKKKLEPYNPTKLHHFKFHYIVYALILSLATLVAPPAKTNAKTACHHIVFLYVPASGQSRYSNDDWPAFYEAVTSRFSTSGLSYGIDSLSYPAVSISSELLPLVFTKSAKNYNASVAAGVNNLKTRIKETKASCKNTKFALAGFSQGAQVVSTALLDLDPNDILYAATMGDPKLYLPEGQAKKSQSTPDACLNRNLSPYRVNVPDCKAAEGWLGGRKPYVKESMLNKVGAWCANGDPICSSEASATLAKSFSKNSKDIAKASLNLTTLNKTPDEVSEKANNLIYSVFQAHDSYHKTGAYKEAADHMLDRAAALFPSKHLKTLEPTAKAKNDVAILIDTTNFDTPVVYKYIASARKLAKDTYAENGRVALYALRINTIEPISELCNFSCTADELDAKLTSLSVATFTANQHNPRSVLWGSSNIMQQLSWRTGANKSLVIYTHETYYSPDLNGTTLTDVVNLSRSIDPVNFFIVGTNSAAYQELAESTGGQVFTSPDTDLSGLLTRPAAIVTPGDGSTLTTFTLAPFKETFASLGRELDENDTRMEQEDNEPQSATSSRPERTKVNKTTSKTSSVQRSIPLAPNSGAH